jgi:hypothetical protein
MTALLERPCSIPRYRTGKSLAVAGWIRQRRHKEQVTRALIFPGRHIGQEDTKILVSLIG